MRNGLVANDISAWRNTMPGGQFLELLLLKWSDFDNSKIAAGYFTHNYGLDQKVRVKINKVNLIT